MLVRSSRAALRCFLVDAGSLAGGGAAACIARRLYVQLLCTASAACSDVLSFGSLPMLSVHRPLLNGNAHD